MDFGAIVFGLCAMIAVIIFVAICWGLSAAFWRLVDRIFGWGEFNSRRSRKAGKEE